LTLFAKFIELKEGEHLYKEGSSGGSFFFVMTGTLELLVKKGDEFKYSKGIDESTFFGHKKYFNEPRNDYAKVTSAKL
jgi:CRP-like cAMP-binding protein